MHFTSGVGQFAVAAGHHLAAEVGIDVLRAGGNAIDAGVAAGLMLCVVESEYVNFAGVAPMMIYLGDSGRLVSISGLGGWPNAANCAFFQANFEGAIPPGILRSVVPGAPDAWLTALERFGTMSFGEVAAPAIAAARGGFRMYDLLHDIIREYRAIAARWTENAAIYLPGGVAPQPGVPFVQEDLGRTLQFLADEEGSRKRIGRSEGIEAARRAFYEGDIAHAIAAHQRANGGLLSEQDLAGFRVQVANPLRVGFRGIDVYGCGPWCQGPMLLQQLTLLDAFDLNRLGHNSADYVHILCEAIKLCAADREAYYGDPDFVAVPIETLLSQDYARRRRDLICLDRAWPDMPPAGDVGRPPPLAVRNSTAAGLGGGMRTSHDTSYVCAVDRHGNAFSATPSDGSLDAPIVPGLGFAVSTRGEQSWVDPRHPSCVAPGKRPRLTPNPAIAVKPGEFVMPFGSPGMDVQTQVMLQAFLNACVFGMDLQAAVEAPRFSAHSFPGSSEPHDYVPGLVYLERGIGEDVADALVSRGHKVERWPESGPEYYRYISSVCCILADFGTGRVTAGADSRRPSGGFVDEWKGPR